MRLDHVCVPLRYHVTLGFLLRLFPALHHRVYLVGLPSSHQPPGLQRTVRDGGIVHSGTLGVSVFVPEYGGTELSQSEQSVGQVHFNTTHAFKRIPAAHPHELLEKRTHKT